MGTMSFLIPGSAPTDLREAMRRACIAGGYDHSPTATNVELSGELLLLRRDVDESGYLQAPWDIESMGRFVGTSATLMERVNPYHLLRELARGKVNQVRNQAIEWEQLGLQIPAPVKERIKRATHAFGQSVLELNGGQADYFASESLSQAYLVADDLVQVYVDQLFAIRHQRVAKLETIQACRLNEVPAAPLDQAFRSAFNTVCIPFTWRIIEPTETSYNWEAVDQLIRWSFDNHLGLTAGPLIDFTSRGIPEWLLSWEGDLPSLSSFMCDYIETTITRYKNSIRRWVICSGSNCSRLLGLSEDDLIRLTARLAEAAWGIDSSLEILVGLGQPWGEYLSSGEFQYSPFVFADTLLRAGLPFAGFELEWHMGSWPRGSYCRDRLDICRLLDTLSILGIPLQVAMSYPSESGSDPLADPEQIAARNGFWKEISPRAQAEWAEAYVSLALAKPNISGLYWDHFHDGQLHRMPFAGVIDRDGNPKPALERLHQLKEAHLRDGPGSMLSAFG